MALESYLLSEQERCPAHRDDCTELGAGPHYPHHVMVNVGYDQAWCGDLFRCVCGRERHGNSDEMRYRATSGQPRDVLLAELGF